MKRPTHSQKMHWQRYWMRFVRLIWYSRSKNTNHTLSYKCEERWLTPVEIVRCYRLVYLSLLRYSSYCSLMLIISHILLPHLSTVYKARRFSVFTISHNLICRLGPNTLFIWRRLFLTAQHILLLLLWHSLCISAWVALTISIHWPFSRLYTYISGCRYRCSFMLKFNKTEKSHFLCGLRTAKLCFHHRRCPNGY